MEENQEALGRLDDRLKPPPELEEFWQKHPEIVKLGDPVLRMVAKPVVRFTKETQELIKRMETIMRDADGLGLAAPQVGVSQRILVYDVGEGLQVLINPKIVHRSGEQVEPPEGCLSIPGLRGIVARAKEVKVKGFDERGRPVVKKVSDLEARVIQHEVDHLDGILFIDRADPETLVWVIEEESELEVAGATDSRS
ncbi:peptide deformylase [Chthonomonas calidirosea]|uniref:Peptide deformylase n=1 Tax=Chthonomonas calidirosea (strain DSM 23976 / ICMP 18418 / T49) TaxID=1303518 RepID=S0EYG6_CHTCT|nr:peptide deformylase [Chthonomonas calidirosea]CCW34897.1 peptide deformylase [Chthonomonas calidirosea T49]CEK12547.1 peptide deformylase [Chthonomonas calidirosea]CEK13479.1 peptide deformylase [Chthonomonas calidirosea]